MADRFDNIDETQPTGQASPRRGDDELRAIKAATKLAYGDLHTETGATVTHRDTYHADIQVDTNANIDGTIVVDGTSTLTGAVTATGGVVGNLTGNVTGNLTGDVNASGGNTVFDSGTDGTDAVLTGRVDGNLRGDVQSSDGTSVLDSGTDGTNATATLDLTGDVTGNLTGDSTGAHNGTVGATTPTAGNFTTVGATGAITGNLTGNVTGDLTGDVTGDVTGRLVAPDGSQAAPSITNQGDTNTGIYFPADDIIAFTSNGTRRGRFTANGRFGIGIDSPTVPLHVNGSALLGNTEVADLEVTGNTTVSGVLGDRVTDNRTSVSVTQFITTVVQTTNASLTISGGAVGDTINIAFTTALTGSNQINWPAGSEGISIGNQVRIASGICTAPGVWHYSETSV